MSRHFLKCTTKSAKLQDTETNSVLIEIQEQMKMELIIIIKKKAPEKSTSYRQYYSLYFF